MNETQTQIPQAKAAAKPAANEQQPRDRTPIPIERLLFTAPNVHGLKLPDGPDGRNERIMPNLTAGIHGEVRIEIEHRPWIRVFRVAKAKRVTSTGKDGKEIAAWVPMGRPYHIPDSWAVSVPVED